MARIFLFIYTLLFLSFGIYAFLNPNLIVDMMGATDMASAGIYELRSNYGGVSMGIGLMCLAGALRPVLQRPALYVLVAYTGGYALGRFMALPLDGVPPANLIAYTVFETVTAILAALLLRRLARSS